jgi:putative membrane protein
MTIPTFSLLHAGTFYPTGWLHSDWRPEPAVVLGIFALIAAYLWFTGPNNRTAGGETVNPVSGGQRVAFVAGSLVVLIALNPPLDDWSDYYLLSAHMAEHMLLIFLAVPLWLVGTPAWLLRRLVAPRIVNRVGSALTRPVMAFVVSNAIIAVWHVAPLYDAALRRQPVHVAEHLSFILAAVLAWWPVIGPLPEWPRLSRPLRCLYLFLYSIPGGLVGAFITLAAPGLYAPYANAPRIWGMSLATDQQIAGLMMWVLASTIYLGVMTVIFFQWAAEEEANEQRGPGPARPLDAVQGRLLDSSTSSLPG